MMANMIYKLTDQDLKTHGGFQWKLGKWSPKLSGGELCGPGLYHGYEHPLLAALHNPAHANFLGPRLFRAEYRGELIREGQMKCGCTQMRLATELVLPQITTEQRVEYAIHVSLLVYTDPHYVKWTNQWLDGTDRSEAAAEAADRAAWAATGAARAAARAAEAAAGAARAAARAAAESATWAAESATGAARAAAGAGIDLLSIAFLVCPDYKEEGK